jgi:hypothetical protein
MPVTVAQVLGVVVHSLGEGYELLPVVQAENQQIYMTSLYHRPTRRYATFSWSLDLEAGLLNERDKIEFARQLLETAIRQLDAHRNPIPTPVAEPDDVVDVDFSED